MPIVKNKKVYHYFSQKHEIKKTVHLQIDYNEFCSFFHNDTFQSKKNI